MDIQQFAILLQVGALSAGAVVAVQQILKLKAIPTDFANKYPVPTNLFLSVVAAFLAVWAGMAHPVTILDYVGFITYIAVVAAIVYNNTLRNWTELREMEGTK